MKGCVLYGRYVFASPGKNERILQKRAHIGVVAAAPDSEANNDREE
jgi:hypothetical protein